MELHVVKSNLRSVLQRIQTKASDFKNPSPKSDVPRLVAVSKTFPVDFIKTCYEDGQRHFGENYMKELIEKANELKDQCPNIKWHYIGRLQSNQINKLASTPNLWCIETLSSTKHAGLLQKSCESHNSRLNVFIQVNTSGEENKGGAEPHSDAPNVAEYITKECPNLNLMGLMTIGSIAESMNREANADFQKLQQVRTVVANKLGKAEADLELSMGMSQDFELAIEYGSTNLRVGSTIFGTRGQCPIHNCPHT